MIQDNPFADLIPQGAPQPMTPPAQQQAPGIIYGRPKQPTTLEVRRETRADEDQAFQRENAARAARNEQRVIENQARQIAAEERKVNQTSGGTESERTAAFLATRVAGGMRDILDVTGRNPDAARPELDATLFGGIVGNNVLNSEDRQRVEAAQLDVLDAALTLGTGAAYTKEQLDGYRQSYFPQYWDAPETVKDKEKRLARLLESARVKAGVSAPLIDEALGRASANAGGGDIAARPAALTGENVVDFMSGLSGGQYDINEDGSVNYNGQPVEVGAGIANSDEFRAAYQQKFGRLPPVQVDVEGGEIDPDAMASERGQGNDQGDRLDAFIRGVADVPTMGLADEIAAAGQTLFGGGTMAQNLQAERNVDRYDEQNNFGYRLGGQVLGGGVLPVGGARSATQLAKVGGIYGAGYGVGSTEGNLGERAVGGAIGGLVGAGSAAALARLGQAASGRFGGGGGGGGPRGVNQELVDAAERQGVGIVRADADPSKRSLTGFLETLPFSGGRIRQDLQRGADQIENRVSEIGGGQAPAPRQTVGENVAASARQYIDRSRAVVNRLYDRAATLAGNAQITPTNALKAVDDNISQLSQTPNSNSTALSMLQQFRSDLVDDAGNMRPLSIQAVRDLRTAMRGELGAKGLRFTDTERRIMQAIDAASTDISSQLTGPALRAFQRADRSYKERANLVDNVVEKFIGSDRLNPRSGEQVISAMENAARPRSGNAAALDKFVQRLEPAEREEAAALVAGTLGRPDGPDGGFSVGTFLQNIKTYSPEARAAIFGKKGAADLADLQTIAEGRKGTMGMLNNSRSGQAQNWFNALGSIFSGGGVGAAAGALTGVGAGTGLGAGLAVAPLVAGGAFMTARALGNPKFLSTMAAATKANTPQAQQNVLKRLSIIASREPALAQDILPIQEALQQSIRSAAADETSVNQPQRGR